MADQDPAPIVIEHKSYARVGLLGNPSDVYFGRTISFSLGNFFASVKLQSSRDLVIQPHPVHDLVQFDSLDHLANRLEKEGYYGGVRLLMAICKVFYKYCKENSIELNGANFTLSYDTDIPRQTGLSGSSAIVSAALQCLLDFFNVRHLVKVEVRPKLILSAENELGIVAGLQDRVAQVYGGLVYMDFSKEHMDKFGYGIYTPMDVDLLPPLHLIYAENPSDSGKVHSTVRKRWLDGDEFIISSMKEVADLALEGRAALLEKNYYRFAELMNRNFDLRRYYPGRNWSLSVQEHLNKSLGEDGLTRESQLSKPSSFLSHPLPECSCRTSGYAKIPKAVTDSNKRVLYGGEDECPKWMQNVLPTVSLESVSQKVESDSDTSEEELDSDEQPEFDDKDSQKDSVQSSEQDDEMDPND